jgi:hypothetical protein
MQMSERNRAIVRFVLNVIISSDRLERRGLADLPA